MRVKTLEVVGFKSFANKTTIHFEPGVTAIVGPNGTGKSNIVDAIRWVLGEHNPRDVRAPRLEDVIFNGTDRRAPISMAEVSLTLDNAQGRLPLSFTEVTITRRVYRSGESECCLNQSPCRLRDIQELFLGTGLGGGTYAIIEQGHIDMILSSKPEERRVVFEEASGVAKYLAKKHETMRKLDEVEAHLLRIADIIGEVRRQVGALERAANKARQYKTQWEHVQQLELILAVDELCGGVSRDRELEATLQRLTGQREALEATKRSHMSALEACHASVSAIQHQLQQLHAQVVACTSQIEQHESQAALKARWIEELGQQAQAFEREDAQLRERIAQCEERLARGSGGHAELQDQLAALKEQLAGGHRELAVVESAIQEATRTVEQAKGQLFEAAADAASKRNELAQVTSRMQGMDAQLARLDAQLAQAAARDEELRRRQEHAQQEREQLDAQQTELHARADGAQQALDAATTRRHEFGGRLHQLRDQVAEQRAQVALREELYRRYEGFPETVKTLMAQGVEGLLGPLVDLVQAAPGYEDIVEAALGPLADALVVRDRGALARCRGLLAGQRLESCRFLVLADCPTAPAMESAAADAGVSGAVKQYVRAAPQYQPLVDWILNDSWIIDDIQRLLGHGSIPQSRLVSRTGDRWDRRSWRFGGARAAQSGRIGRRQRWEDAQAGLRTLEEEFRQLEAVAKTAEQEWQRLLAEQESVKGQLAQLAPGLQKLEHQLAPLRHEGERIEEEQRARRLEVEDLTKQREELRAALVLTQRLVEESQVRQSSLERSLTEAQATRAAANDQRQQLRVSQAQLEATRASLTERLQTIQARLQELDADRARLRGELETKTRQRAEAATRAQELTQQIAAHEQGRAQQGEARAALDGEVARMSDSLRAEETTRDQVLPQLMAVEQELSTLAQAIQQHTQQLSERQFRRSHLLQRLRELYQLDETTIQVAVSANPAPLTDEQRATMTEQVQKLRAKLEGMGPVSLGSVEEYDALKQRHDFLLTQQQDLIKGRDDLRASITQINRTARAQFRETFERIRQEFKHYYGRLFSGGEADLLLMDEEDVLECGIDIVARPPGKRLQNISLLSGGERALTAVALLFALFKVRPSPFCILDEIDAPLDEANVDRFTRVLEEFLSLSQFILITHNKKTITKADSLYGVTMEEAGVSKILSAKLTQDERTPAPAPVAA